MRTTRRTLIAAALLAGVSAPALGQTGEGNAGPRYVKADGTRTDDRAAAEASWRADPEFQADWGLGAIHAEAAYALGFTGKDIKLGINDSGTWAGHPEFSNPGKLVPITVEGIRSVDIAPFKAGDTFRLDGGLPWFDGENFEDHGTHVGGTMAAQRDGKGMYGVAFDATLIATQLFGDHKVGGQTEPTRGYPDLLDEVVFSRVKG